MPSDPTPLTEAEAAAMQQIGESLSLTCTCPYAKQMADFARAALEPTDPAPSPTEGVGGGPGCKVCGDEKILMEPDGSKAQPCYACQPVGTTLEQASRPYEPRATEGAREPEHGMCAHCGEPGIAGARCNCEGARAARAEGAREGERCGYRHFHKAAGELIVCERELDHPGVHEGVGENDAEWKWWGPEAEPARAPEQLLAEAREGEAIDRSEWQWHGLAGHFICSDRCCFRLHTVVGSHRISTVGCYHPVSDESGKPHTIGAGRLYETMVFAVDDDGPTSELDFTGYNTEEDAQRGHIAMCEKWAAASPNPIDA